MSDEAKANALTKFAEAELCLIDGADEHLQLLSTLSAVLLYEVQF